MQGSPSAFELLLATKGGQPPTPLTTPAAAAAPTTANEPQSTQAAASAERVGAGLAVGLPAVGLPAVGLPAADPTARESTNNSKRLTETATAAITSRDATHLPSADTTPGVTAPSAGSSGASVTDADPCPVATLNRELNTALESHPRLAEQSSPVANQERSPTDLGAAADRAHKLVQETAQPVRDHRADAALEPVTTANSLAALPLSNPAHVVGGTAATGVVSIEELRPGRTGPVRESLPAESAPLVIASAELRQLFAKDFARLLGHAVSIQEERGSHAWVEPVPASTVTTAVQNFLKAITTRPGSAEHRTPATADTDRVAAPSDRDPAPLVAPSPVASTVAAPFKSNADAPVTIAAPLATAVLRQFEDGPWPTSRTFRMRLDPRELGPLEVQLTVVNDVVSIRFVAHDDAARHVLSRQLDDLRQSLTDSGVSFGPFEVGSRGGGGHGSQHPGGDHRPPHPLPPAPVPVRASWSRLPSHDPRSHDPRDDRLPGRLNFVA